MNDDIANADLEANVPRFKWLKIVGIIVVAITIATVIMLWTVTTYFFPTELKPVTLSSKEEQILNAKLSQLDSGQRSSITHKKQLQSHGEIPLAPEPYKEELSRREIVLSEKEINALLSTNTDLAKKLAIDLSDDLASAKFLLPLDEDFPFIGGKTLKVTTGLELGYANGKPIVALKGISIWGAPVPNAWLGNLKNVDLVKEFGAEKGFWRTFAAGIDEIKIEEGSMRIKLKE